MTPVDIVVTNVIDSRNPNLIAHYFDADCV